MTEYVKWESDGRFAVSERRSGYSFDGGDLGSGDSQVVTCFESAEAREYFIQARTYEDAMNATARGYRYFKEELAACFTKSGRVRRKKLLALAGKVA